MPGGAWSADVTAQFNLLHSLLYPIRACISTRLSDGSRVVTTAYFIPVTRSWRREPPRVCVQVLIPEFQNHIMADCWRLRGCCARAWDLVCTSTRGTMTVDGRWSTVARRTLTLVDAWQYEVCLRTIHAGRAYGRERPDSPPLAIGSGRSARGSPRRRGGPSASSEYFRGVLQADCPPGSEEVANCAR